MAILTLMGVGGGGGGEGWYHGTLARYCPHPALPIEIVEKAIHSTLASYCPHPALPIDIVEKAFPV
jgi:hypothetical protein